MGFTARETGLLYIGQFKDCFEEYKKIHNAKMKKSIFLTGDDEKEASLKDLR